MNSDGLQEYWTSAMRTQNLQTCSFTPRQVLIVNISRLPFSMLGDIYFGVEV